MLGGDAGVMPSGEDRRAVLCEASGGVGVDSGESAAIAAESTARAGRSRSLALTGVSNAAVAGLGAATSILAARILGPQGRGEVAAAVAWSAVFVALAEWGVSQSLAYATARRELPAGSVLRAALTLWLIQSTLILIVGMAAAHLFLSPRNPAAAASVMIFLPSVPASLLLLYVVAIAQGLRRFTLFNLARVGPLLAWLSILLSAIVTGLRSPRALLLSLLAAYWIVVAVACVVLIRHTGLSQRLDFGAVRMMLAFGARAYGGNLSWMLNARVDQFIMGAVVTLAALGHYAVASSYAMGLYTLSTTFAVVAFPEVAVAGGEAGAGIVRKTLRLNLLVSLLLGVALAAAAPIVLPWVFGSEFDEAVVPAIILVGGSVLLSCGYVLSDGLRGLGDPLAGTIGQGVGCLVTVVGLGLFLRSYGIHAAAWVSVASYAAVTLVLSLRFRARSAAAAVTS